MMVSPPSNLPDGFAFSFEAAPSTARPITSNKSPTTKSPQSPTTPPLARRHRSSPRRILFASEPEREHDSAHDSPQFSDYWTDPSRSLQTSPTTSLPAAGKIHAAPPSGCAVLSSLLARLHGLAARLLADEPEEEAAGLLADLLAAKIDEVEALLAAPQSQSKPSADVADSGLFVDDSDDEDEGYMVKRYGIEAGSGGQVMVDSVMGAEMKIMGPEGWSGMRELELKTQKNIEAVVQGAARIALELRARLEEVKHFNDVLVTRLEKTHTKLLAVQTENDRLTQDLAFDKSDLLLLKLQMKSLELIVDPLGHDDVHDLEFTKAIDKWKDDCADAESRVQGRIQRHEAFSGQYNGRKLQDAGIQTDSDITGAAEDIDEEAHEPSLAMAHTAPPDTIAREDSLATLVEDDSEMHALYHKHNELVHGFILPQLSDSRENWLEAIAQLQAITNSIFGTETPRDAEPVDEGKSVSVAEEPKAEEAKDEVDDSKADAEKEPEKTPWQELWSSLTEFVGMAEQGYESS